MKASSTKNGSKDTIYIDAEDDITVIIEKVLASEAKIVALVLPKRATTLQSIVNLKLLKRSSNDAKKSLVLITSEAGLSPIAGAAGIHIAKSLQSKPSVPSAPKASFENKNAITDADDVPIDTQTSVGELAGHVAAEETIDLDNDAKDELTTESKSKIPFNKKLKIPNFNKFRLALFGGIGLLILLIVGGYFALIVLPKAKIVIKTDTTNVTTDLKIIVKTDVATVDAEKLIIPGIGKQLKKTDTEKATATGQRDEGEKATGVVTLTNCSKVVGSISVPAGTKLTTNNLDFITQETVKIPESSFNGADQCKADTGFKNVNVKAQNPGGQYNVGSSKSFDVSGFSGITGKNGSAFTGGTSNLVKVVSQSDIDNAKQKVVDRITAAGTTELSDQFVTDNSIAITDTFSAGDAGVVSTPVVNEPATEVSVTVTITFTELGVKNDDLKQIVENDINKNIDTSKQVIQDNGLSTAQVQTTEKKSDKEVTINVKTLAIAGPQLDEAGIKSEIAGKKKNQTQEIIQSRPGIIDVTVDYSPFWVFSTPKNTKHISITFDQSNAGQ